MSAGEGKAAKPDFDLAPHFSTSSSTMPTVWRHVVLVVAMILTASSKSVVPQSRRPNPASATHAWAVEAFASSANSAVSIPRPSRASGLAPFLLKLW